MGLFGKSGGGSTVGINIGSSLIKVVEAKPTKDGIQISAIGVAPTPPGAIENEVVAEPQALGQAIRQLLAESGISCKRCVSSVAGQSSVVVRIIEVPKMTKQELAETMKWEVERHVPFAASDVVMDFQPIERPTSAADDQNMEVLLAVAQQEVVNSHVEALFAAGLEPAVIDVECLAACRSLIDLSSNGAREQTIAIVNVGAASTELGVYQNGLLAFPRTLPIAGDAITRALSDGLNIPVPQAERLKRERAIVLLDRAAQFSPAVSVSDAEPMGGYEEPEAAVDVSASAAEEGSEMELGFIPGLGYGATQEGEEQEKQEEEAETVTGVPDFDIEIGGRASEPAKPAMDYDLSTGEEESEPDAADQETQSEPVDGDVEGENLAVPAILDQSASDESLEEISEEADLTQFSEELISDALMPVLSDLIAEVRRSLEYYASRFQGQPDRILLCGGTARLKGLDRLLEAELGIPVVLANPLQNVTVFSEALSQDYLSEVATVFPVSVGLAVRDMMGE